jgi:hypothetical protein
MKIYSGFRMPLLPLRAPAPEEKLLGLYEYILPLVPMTANVPLPFRDLHRCQQVNALIERIVGGLSATRKVSARYELNKSAADLLHSPPCRITRFAVVKRA